MPEEIEHASSQNQFVHIIHVELKISVGPFASLVIHSFSPLLRAEEEYPLRPESGEQHVEPDHDRRQKGQQLS